MLMWLKMTKSVMIRLTMFSRTVIDEETIQNKKLFSFHLEDMRRQIWNKLKSLKYEDLEQLPVEIKDWPL